MHSEMLIANRKMEKERIELQPVIRDRLSGRYLTSQHTVEIYEPPGCNRYYRDACLAAL